MTTTLDEAIEAEETVQAATTETEPEPEPEPEPAPEPEPEAAAAAPEPAVALTPERIKKAERAIETHRRKIAELLGPEYAAHECILCAGAGSIPDLPPVGTVFELAQDGDEIRFIVQAPRLEPDYRASSAHEQCVECAGWGQVLTGAKTEGGRLQMCTRCAGAGFIVKGQPAPPPMFAPADQFTPSPATPEGVVVGVVDNWGRPAGHPHWGINPANVPL